MKALDKKRESQIREMQHTDGQYVSQMMPGMQVSFRAIEDLLSFIDYLRDLLIDCQSRLSDGDNSDELYCKINEVLEEDNST